MDHVGIQQMYDYHRSRSAIAHFRASTSTLILRFSDVFPTPSGRLLRSTNRVHCEDTELRKRGRLERDFEASIDIFLSARPAEHARH